MSSEKAVDHPAHYGGADDPYETIKVIEAWDLGFHLGNAVKYISRIGLKGTTLENTQKAIWYLRRFEENEAKREEEGWATEKISIHNASSNQTLSQDSTGESSSDQ